MIQRLMPVIFCLALSSVTIGQQSDSSETPQGPPKAPASSTIERSYSSGSATSSRTIQTHTQSGNREVVTETTQAPGPDGTLRTTTETTTETVHVGPNTVQTTQNIFNTDAQGRRQLTQTTQTDQQTLPDGTSRTVENTSAPDLNGRLAVTEQRIQETKSTGPNVKQTDTSVYLPGINSTLTETERIQETEREVQPDLTQTESTRFVRDANGRWQATETHAKEVRTEGAEHVEEETIQRLDANGALSLNEKNITRRSTVDGKDQVTTETYSRNVAGGGQLSGNQLKLTERHRITTTPTPDGGHQTVEEVESGNPVAPSDPLRVVERTVETVRKVGPDQWETERQVFALDGNGKLVPVISEKGQSAGQ